MAAFVDKYAEPKADGILAPIDPMLINRPLDFRNSGKNALVILTVPKKFTFIFLS